MIHFYAVRILLILPVLLAGMVISAVVLAATRLPLFSLILITLVISVLGLARVFSRFTLVDSFNLAIRQLASAGLQIEGGRKTHEGVTDGIYVIRLTEPLVGDKSNYLVEKVNELLRNEHRRILVDLSEVRYMDAAGVGALVSCLASAQRAGAQLKLLNLTSPWTEMVKVESYSDERTAIAAFDPSRS